MKVYILYIYQNWETHIGQVYSSYTKAYEAKKKLLEDKYNRMDGVVDVEIEEREVL